MWLWTQAEAKQIDDRTLHSGIAAADLMEKAGQRSAQKIRELYPQARSAVVLCGPGNNGGDGRIVARELKKHHIQTRVFELPRMAEEFLQASVKADLWIDAIFGLGLSRPVQEPFRSAILRFNQNSGAKISLDTPSGLQVDTGNILGVAIQAHHTLTVGHPKPGFFLNQGPAHVGRIHCIDIDFPQSIVQQTARNIFLLNPKLVSRWLPRRLPTDHKNRGGRSLIWAGSPKMPGAALLATQAASRMGSGYVYTSSREILKFQPEAILWKKSDLPSITAALIGPGLGVKPATLAALRWLRKQSKIPVVIDADALTVAAEKGLAPFPSHWVATPHAGELARFFKGSSAAEIEKDRLKFAALAQKKLGCVVVLKGYHTVVATPDVRIIVPTGNVALAKGGSGDVLAGMITGLLAQGLSSERAALVGCSVHGMMADHWLRSGRDVLSLTPSDLVSGIPQALAYCRKDSLISFKILRDSR